MIYGYFDYGNNINYDAFQIFATGSILISYLVFVFPKIIKRDDKV